MNCNLLGSSVHGDSPGKNTRVGCHALLQGIFPTQGWNPGLPHCRQILYQLGCILIKILVPYLTCCSAAKLCLTLWELMDCSTLGLPVLHYLPEFAQTHVRWVIDAIQPSHPFSSASPPALNLSQHPFSFQWVGSSHLVAKVLEFQLQLQLFQRIFRVDCL